MNSSSAQSTYSITLNNDDYISTSDITLTPSYTINTSSVSYSGGATISIGNLTTSSVGTINSIDITGINSTTFTFKDPVDFVDKMPDLSRISKMCEEYPGLKIAFEKFQTTYNLVKDDYDTPKDKRVKP